MTVNQPAKARTALGSVLSPQRLAVPSGSVDGFVICPAKIGKIMFDRQVQEDSSLKADLGVNEIFPRSPLRMHLDFLATINRERVDTRREEVTVTSTERSGDELDVSSMDRTYQQIMDALTNYPVEQNPKWEKLGRNRKNFRRFSIDPDVGSLQFAPESMRFDGRARVLVEWDRTLRSGLAAPGCASLPVFFVGHISGEQATLDRFDLGDPV